MNKVASGLLVMAFSACNAQIQNINLTKAGYNSYNVEPSIIINLKNPEHVMAASVLDVVHISMDGGKTWENKQLQSKWGVFGDPCLVADDEGGIYYFHLSMPPVKDAGMRMRRKNPGRLDRMVVHRTDDMGKTWTDSHTGYNHPKDQDKEWAVVDQENNIIYAAWTEFDRYGSDDPNHRTNIVMTRSYDRADTWTQSKVVNDVSGDCHDDDSAVEGSNLAVGPNGEVYLAWALGTELFFDVSTDRGETWGKDIKVADQPGGWNLDIDGINRTNGMPVIKCDLSGGKNHGTIYVNWVDQAKGEKDSDVKMALSKDGGKTWSKPMVIDKDKSGKHQFLTWMDIDQTTGYLYCVYYDRSQYDDLQTDVCVAWSEDGGKSFKHVRISEKPFTPTKDRFFGDYNNIAAHAGKIFPIWTRMDNGKTSIWTAALTHDMLKEAYKKQK